MYQLEAFRALLDAFYTAQRMGYHASDLTQWEQVSIPKDGIISILNGRQGCGVTAPTAPGSAPTVDGGRTEPMTTIQTSKNWKGVVAALDARHEPNCYAPATGLHLGARKPHPGKDAVWCGRIIAKRVSGKGYDKRYLSIGPTTELGLPIAQIR
jgi:hypothetical protein